MNSKNMLSRLKSSPLFIGTILLTGSGVLSRMIGFFYRIFLSRTIGAKSLGIYQLVFPFLSLIIAISSSGIQTAISKHVAGAVSRTGKAFAGHKNARRYLAAGLVLSLLASLLFTGILHLYGDWIAVHFLREARCGPLLRAMSYALIPCGIHNCINGYYYGRKKAGVPSASQLAEQVARVFSVVVIYLILFEKGIPLTEVHAMWGLVIGELAGLIYSLTAIGFENITDSQRVLSRKKALRDISALALPLTTNQALVHLCASMENAFIPQQLQAYGYTANEALAIYGVLSGMAISVIFFPGVLTNSISVLLLPTISSAQAKGEQSRIRQAISRAIFYGLGLGIVFTVLFLISGNFIGNVIFRNALAGEFIRRLGWLCPMMYVYALLSSVMHGLGKAKYVLYINLLASGIRIGMILFFVPSYGLSAVLWGMLLSQLFSAVAAIFCTMRR